MVLVASKTVSFLFEIEGMIKLGNPIFELIGYFRLAFGIAENKSAYLVEKRKGDAMRVDIIIAIKKVQPFLLVQSPQDELLFLSIGKEKALAQEGQIYLAGLVDEVEDPVHKYA